MSEGVQGETGRMLAAVLGRLGASEITRTATTKLARLRTQPGADALVDVLPLLNSGNPDVLEDARRGVSAFVRALPSVELARLDEDVRRVVFAASWDSMHIWPLSAQAVDAWELADAEAAPVLGVASMHPSGYVREAALRRLASLQMAEALPFLLLRASDWVPTIRRSAETALRERMRNERVPEWVPHVALVHRLVTRARRSDEFTRALTAWIASSAGQPVPWAGLDAAEGRVRRWSFGLLRAAAGEVTPVLAARAAESADPIIRLQAVRLVDALGSGGERQRLLARLLADPVGRIRREALRALAPPPGDERVERALFDRNFGVRTVAQQLARRGGTQDLAALYREVVDAGDARLPVALLGLGEMGGRDDLRRFVRHLGHPKPAVRRTALRAVTRLDRPGADSALLRALGDDSPVVSLAARDGLDRPGFAVREQVETCFHGDERLHVRRNALWLLVRGSKWSAIRWALEAAASPDEGLAEQGRRYVARWIGRYNRGAITPTPDDLRRLRSALDAAAGRIPAEWEEWIRSAVGGF